MMFARLSFVLLVTLAWSGVALAQETSASSAAASSAAASSAAASQDTSNTAAPASDDLLATLVYPRRQQATQWLGLSLIGAKVVSANGDAVGRIANLIVDEDGTVASVIIEVGGLLGVGGKNVAVTYRSLKIARNQAGDAIDHVTIAATKDELARVAAFKSLRQQMAEVRARR